MSAGRRRRIQKLKRFIVGMTVAGIAASLGLSLVLLAQIYRMYGRLNSLGEQAAELAGQTKAMGELLKAQEEKLDALLEEKAVVGQGTPGINESGRAPQDQTKGALTEKAGESEEPEESGKSEEPGKPVSTAAHRVYLTFDDGPSAYTDDILDILDQYDVKATFFVVGKETESARAALRDIVARGHTLGMHSYSHKYADIYRSVEDFAEDFTKLRDYLSEVTGVTSSVYRFPGGSSNTISKLDMHEFADYLTEQEVTFFDWNISSGDGVKDPPSVEVLVKNATADILRHETSIILMHDSVSKKTTLEALPTIIETILAMEDTEILPITEETEPVQHIH